MKELTILFFSTWKFAATFPVAVLIMHMSFFKTILLTNIGGVAGALVFSFFSKWLIRMFNRYWPDKWRFYKKSRKVFKKNNRRLVKIKSKYGLPGIVILSPSVLSIPVGAFLVAKYYGRKKSNVLWLIVGQILWSFIFTWFYAQISIK